MTSARFRLLPVEATEAMITAGCEAWCAAPIDGRGKAFHRYAKPVERVFQAMLSAAPVTAEATPEMLAAAYAAWEDYWPGRVITPSYREVLKHIINAALAIAAGQLGEKET